jgi:hypothetical protein
VVLYECETWSQTLREEQRLRASENRVLRRIFGPKRDEVIGGWRKLHNEELRDWYSSPSVILIIKSRRKRWAGHVARKGEKRNTRTCRILVRKPKRNRPRRRLRRRWVYNIEIDLGEIGWGGVDWADVTQDTNQWRAIVNTVMNLWGS